MQKEPLVTIASLTAAAAAVITALVAFGLDLTTGQTASIMGLVAVAAPLIVAATVRGKVASPATVARLTANTDVE